MAETQEQTPSAAPAATESADLMQSLLTKAEGVVENAKDGLEKAFDRSKDEFAPVKKGIDALIAYDLKGKLVGSDVLKRITSAIAYLDGLLSDQVNAIMHHPDFLQLEGAWRGLNHLVKNTPTSQRLKIRVLNVSKKELGKVLEKFDAESGQQGYDQSPIFKHIFESRFDMPGGEPFGCLIGDYQFDQGPQDVGLLSRIARIAGAAHVPFVSAAAPKILGMKSWQELSDPASLAAKMSTPDYAGWNSLRQSEDSRYLALTVPRFLARLPYGANTVPVDAFAFEEDLRPAVEGGTTHDNYVWANAAYAMAVNIGRSFNETGFCVRIRGVESGGVVEGLPIHTFPTTDGGLDAKCPTEIAIAQRRENELSRLGFMPLSHYVGTDYGMFVGAQTVQKPVQYDDPRATENAELSARLPYIFMVSRFAHYLKKSLYDQVGSFKERAQIEEELNRWIRNYTSDPTSAQDVKAERPLAEAKIEVSEIDGKPGFYTAVAYLRPHIQLEGVEVKLGVVSRIPGAG